MIYEVEMWAFCNGAVMPVSVPGDGVISAAGSFRVGGHNLWVHG